MALAEVCGLQNYLAECKIPNNENYGLTIDSDARNLVNNMELALPPFGKVCFLEYVFLERFFVIDIYLVYRFS